MNSGILKFKLTNFYGAFIKELEGADGSIEECVCIPLVRNGLRKAAKGSVSAYCFVNKTNIVTVDNWTHYLQLKVSPERVKQMRSLGLKSAPYLGNIKAQNYVTFKEKYDAKLVKVSDYE
jgi:hypothetical protein